MPYPGQVFEDPEYYDEDVDFDVEQDEEYDPFATVNS
jgi:hypothetical protein